VDEGYTSFIILAIVTVTSESTKLASCCTTACAMSPAAFDIFVGSRRTVGECNGEHEGAQERNDRLVGIQEVGTRPDHSFSLILNHLRCFCRCQFFERFSVHSVQLRATRTRIRTDLPTSCGMPRPL
jgi:hypothetical protein